MKKIASIAIALMMVLSVSAMPIKRQSKTVVPDRQNAEVVKKAPTQTQTATGDPTSIIAVNLNGYSTYTTGDFWLYLYDNNDACVAMIDINTGSDNSIVGTHTIGDGSFFGAYFYTEAGGTQYEANYGGISIICTGTENVTTPGGTITCPKYDVVCTNWYDVNNDILVSFKGSAYCVAQKKSDSSTYLPTDTKVNATDVVIDQYLDINTDSVWMWTIEGQDATATYAIEFVSYSNDIASTYYFPNGVYDSNISNNFQTSYSYVTLNGGTNWANPTRVYGYLFETESGDYEFSFYATVSGSVYHFTNIGTPATGIEEVKAAEVDGTAKTMENGQLVIIRNGVRYNAQGAVIKK